MEEWYNGSLSIRRRKNDKSERIVEIWNLIFFETVGSTSPNQVGCQVPKKLEMIFLVVYVNHGSSLFQIEAAREASEETAPMILPTTIARERRRERREKVSEEMATLFDIVFMEGLVCIVY